MSAMKIDIGISGEARAEIVKGLERVLADTYSLYLLTHNFHWNVTGPMFQTLHALFQTQYNELWLAVDDVAERIRTLGHFAPGTGTILARTRMTQSAFGDVVKEGLRLADPTVPVGRLETLQSRRDAMLGPQRLNAVAIGLFALIAFVVAFQGIHAILARAVRDQRRELGIRLALGASPRALLGLVMERGLKVTLAGLLFGVLGSILLGRTLEALLFEVQATDFVTFASVAVIVGAAALLSSYLPGRDAARTEPAVALRQD